MLGVVWNSKLTLVVNASQLLLAGIDESTSQSILPTQYCLMNASSDEQNGLYPSRPKICPEHGRSILSGAFCFWTRLSPSAGFDIRSGVRRDIHVHVHPTSSVNKEDMNCLVFLHRLPHITSRNLHKEIMSLWLTLWNVFCFECIEPFSLCL